LGSVAVAKEGGKIVVDEDPPTTGLAGRKRAPLCAAAHFLRMHFEEGCGFGEGQRLHSAVEVDETRAA
jgi:hypothetical protein